MMKWLALIVLIVGVGFLVKNTATPPPKLVTKTIVEKISPIEKVQQVSASETVYYVVAEDGTYAKVSMGLYLRIKPGNKFAARYWYRD